MGGKTGMPGHSSSQLSDIELIVRDPGHLEAHRSEFALPLEDVLGLAKAYLRSAKDSGGIAVGQELAARVRCPKVVGYGGLARVWPWTRGDYWAPRQGRAIPSHLIVGKRRPTRDLCVWGTWRSLDEFVLHTVYPGRPAPREIHDASLPPSQLPEALRFWTRHAIIVG